MTVFPKFHIVKKNAYKKAVSGFVPRTVYVPLNQENGNDCRLLFKVGDIVEEGELLAEGKAEPKCEFNRYIYSPIPGKIEGIESITSPNGRIYDSVKISLQGKFSYLGKKLQPVNIDYFTQSALVEDIAEKGVINTFETHYPVLLAEQINKVIKANGMFLVVRLFDDDPSRLTDGILSNFFSQEIFEGAKIAAKAMSAKGIVFVSSLEYEPKSDLNNIFDIPFTFIKLDAKKYPCSFPKLICSAVKKSNSDSLFRSISTKDLYIDSSTSLELYRTVGFNMPVIDRYVLVTGNCIPSTGILKIAIGTTFDSIATQCGGFIKEPTSIIVNGQVTGFSAGSLNVPVTKYVKSICFLSNSRTPSQKKSECIRCGNCRRACPVHISPDILFRHLNGGFPTSADYISSISLCIKCGLCNAVCPARLPIAQKIIDFKDSQENASNKEVLNVLE